MIFRFRAGRVISKYHLRLSLNQLFFRNVYTATFRGCTVRQFLCPKIRSFDWKYATPDGQDLEKLLLSTTKGSFMIQVEQPNEWNFITCTPVNLPLKVSFSHKDSALLAKLTMGAH